MPEQDKAQEEGATCLKCPGKCHWTEHHNTPYYFEYVEELQTTTIDSMLKSYNIATSEKEKSHKLLEKMAQEFAEKEQVVSRLVCTIREVLNMLAETALLPQYMTDVKYLEMMIEAQKLESKPGFKKRIEVLNRHLKVAHLIEKALETSSNMLDDATDKESLTYLYSTFPRIFKENAAEVINAETRLSFKQRLKQMFKK